jgi:hypothetical protein
MAERLAGLSLGELEQAVKTARHTPRPRKRGVRPRQRDVFMSVIIA